MEEVLGTIVDAITNVLLVFDDAESSTRKRLTVKETQQLEAAIMILIDLAGKAAATYSPEFQKRMEEVIVDMKKSAEIMRGFSSKTVEQEQHKLILEETKKLLVYAVSMLKIQDEARVKQIIVAGKTLSEVVRRAYDISNARQLLEVGNDLNVQMNVLTALLNKRIGTIQNPALVKSLNGSMTAMRDGGSQIITTSKAVIDSPNDEVKLKARKDTFTGLIEAISQAMSVVARSASLLQSFDIDYFYPGGGGFRRPIDPELLARIAALRMNIAQNLLNLKNTKNKDKSEIAADIRDMAQQIQEQIRLGRDLASKIDDPARKQALEDACDELEKLLSQFVRAARDHFANPDDKKLEAEYLMLADRLAAASAQIQLASLTSMLDNDMQRMLDALNIGDDQGAREAAQKVHKDLTEIIKVAKEIASRVQNPVHKQKLLDAINRLESYLPKFLPAVENVIKNPNDMQAKNALGEIVKNIQDTVTTINDLSIRPLNNPELITLNDLPQRATNEAKEVIKAGISLNDHLDSLALAARIGNSEQISQSAIDVGNDIATMAKYARKVAEQTKDPKLKEELTKAVNDFEALGKDLLLASKSLAANPKDLQLRKKVEDLVEKVRNAGGNVSGIVKKIAEAQEVEAKKAVKAIDARVPKDMADALQQVLLAANASQLPDNSPQGQLVATSRIIAAELEKLSIAEDKKVMITSARTIADSVANVMKLAQEIASKCKNEKLKEALLNVAPVPKNFSTQLKILSAVKASTPDNKSANIQLFDCAKRLAVSVTSVIGAAEAAALASL